MSLSFIRDLMRHYRETGTVQPKPHGGGVVAKIGKEQLPIVATLVRAQPDGLLRELGLIRFCGQWLKRLLRTAKARTREALDQALTHIINEYISDEDAFGWFAHCGLFI